jgi:hypothetical protein
MKKRLFAKKNPVSFSITDPSDHFHYLGYHGTLLSGVSHRWKEPLERKGYVEDAKICEKMFKTPGFSANTDKVIVGLKIYLIDAMNSTNLVKQKSIVTVKRLSEIIVSEKRFDTWLKNGDTKAVTFLIRRVSLIAQRKKKKLEIFSFASKYCFYHYRYLYQKKAKGIIGAYSIYDSLMEKYLQDYPHGPKQSKIIGWKKKGPSGYVLYNNALEKMLILNGCGSRQGARRELDQLVWWEGRKKDKLESYLDDMVKTYDCLQSGSSGKSKTAWGG